MTINIFFLLTLSFGPLCNGGTIQEAWIDKDLYYIVWNSTLVFIRKLKGSHLTSSFPMGHVTVSRISRTGSWWLVNSCDGGTKVPHSSGPVATTLTCLSGSMVGSMLSDLPFKDVVDDYKKPGLGSISPPAGFFSSRWSRHYFYGVI